MTLSWRPAAAAPVKGIAEPVTTTGWLPNARERGRARVRWWAATGSSPSRRVVGTCAVGLVDHSRCGLSGRSRNWQVPAGGRGTERLRPAGDFVLEFTGSPFHTDAGLHPVRTMLERRCGIDRSTDQAERLRLLDAEVRAHGLDPGSTVPLLAPVLGIDAKTGYQPVAAEGRKLYELIAQSVRNYLLACLDCSALVVAEDVHWFDPSTREVLGALLEGADGRMLVVITARPDESLPGNWPATVFDLVPLTDEQTDALISALNPGLRVDERQAVAARCDGVPFYIEQVVAGLGATGVPETLYEPLFARLRASPKVVPVVEAAAVIGRHVDRGLLGSVVDLSDDEVDHVIDELEDALVLEPWGSRRLEVPTRVIAGSGRRTGAPDRAPGPARQGGRCTDRCRRAGLGAGCRPLRARRAVRQGGIRVSERVDRCAASRRPRRGP